MLYLITVCASSPWAMWYCAPWPGEAERCRAARAADEAAGTNTWTVAWVESYWSIFTVSRDFELMCCATFVWAGAASGYSWLLLVLAEPKSSRTCRSPRQRATAAGELRFLRAAQLLISSMSSSLR